MQEGNGFPEVKKVGEKKQFQSGTMTAKQVIKEIKKAYKTQVNTATKNILESQRKRALVMRIILSKEESLETVLLNYWKGN